jgi:hypothetical protein
MPHFRFKVEGDPAERVIELPSIAAAKCEAVKYAGARICDEADRFWDAGGFTLTVADENGLTMAVLMMTGVEAPASSRPNLSIPDNLK